MFWIKAALLIVIRLTRENKPACQVKVNVINCDNIVPKISVKHLPPFQRKVLYDLALANSLNKYEMRLKEEQLSTRVTFKMACLSMGDVLAINSQIGPARKVKV